MPDSLSVPGDGNIPGGGSQPVIDVAAGLIFRRGQLLITQRPSGTHLAGLWEFPGGKRHAGESFEECLRRELLEELGVDVFVRDLMDTVTHCYPGKTVCLKFFRCSLLSGEPSALGCEDLAWVTATELSGYQFPEADTVLLAKLQAMPDLWEE